MFFVRRRGRLRSTLHSYVAVAFRWSALFILPLGILHSGRNDDFHGQLFVDRRDVVTAAAIVEDADDGLLLALHDADDAAFSLAVMPEEAHFHQNLIAVHGIADIGRQNEYV